MRNSDIKYSFHSRNKKFELHTSKQEIKELLIAWLLISITFAIARSQESGKSISSGILSAGFLYLIIISAITVGLAFLLHELAHKVVAQRYKCWAEFRMDIRMLMMALIMSFLGVIFIAPGAVIIFGHINKRQNGIISLAGPATNIIIALLLLPALLMDVSNPLMREIIQSGFLINSWLALFNMIPLWNFDGAKILRWSKIVYAITIVIAALLTLFFFMKSG
jgi:Zn-dependent protease